MMSRMITTSDLEDGPFTEKCHMRKTTALHGFFDISFTVVHLKVIDEEIR